MNILTICDGFDGTGGNRRYESVCINFKVMRFDKSLFILHFEKIVGSGISGYVKKCVSAIVRVLRV